MAPFEVMKVLRKRLFITQNTSAESLYYASEITQSNRLGRFVLHYSLSISMTKLAQIFADLLLYAHVGIYQVRILVFDTFYQACLVPLSWTPSHHLTVLPQSTSKGNEITGMIEIEF